MSESLVTVIVPVFNVERYLRRSVGSIIAQTHTALEVLLINDGSTDSSGVLCDSLAAEDPRIRVVHQSNGGLSMARNAGLAQATGDFLTFVDSDDWLHPEMIETLLTLLIDQQADVGCAAFRRSTAEGQVDPANTEPAFLLVLDPEQALRELIGARHIQLTVAWAKLYRTQLWSELRFPQGRLHEDEFTTYRVLAASRRVIITGQQLYFYRKHGDSIMGSRYAARRGIDASDAFRERADFMAAAGLRELSMAAYREAFKKYAQLHSWLGRREPELRKRLVAEMREVLHRIADDRQPLSFRAFGWLYVKAPSLGSLVYRGRARVLRHGIPAR